MTAWSGRHSVVECPILFAAKKIKPPMAHIVIPSCTVLLAVRHGHGLASTFSELAGLRYLFFLLFQCFWLFPEFCVSTLYIFFPSRCFVLHFPLRTSSWHFHCPQLVDWGSIFVVDRVAFHAEFLCCTHTKAISG